jgi:predicted thioesterase
MHNPFKNGDIKIFKHIVKEDETASFDSGQVHPVYSTFALARDAEWSGRLFVLEMKEGGEEGIGTGINIQHISPALLGQEVVFTSTLKEVNKNEVVTDFVAKVGDRIIAEGTQWQKIINKKRFDDLLDSLALA